MASPPDFPKVGLERLLTQMVTADSWGSVGLLTNPSGVTRDLTPSAVALSRAGLTLDRLHGATETALRDQLRDLGFDLVGDAMDRLFPHHVGHYVGLDVHDVPGYPRRVPLRAGHCVTIEPGVYVPDGDTRFPERFWGLGIRIEDSVCVGDDDPLILTTEAVKEVDDIEALRS